MLLLRVVPISLVVFNFTVYMPSSVMLKLHILSDGARLEHPLSDIRAGPLNSTVTLSIGGVYDDSVLYCMERNT